MMLHISLQTFNLIYLFLLQQLENEVLEKDLTSGLNRTNGDGMLPLHLALQAGNFELAHKFIKHGSRVDLADKLGHPIHYAMKHKQTK